MTLDAAQADIANIPVNSTTYVRSQDGSALADEYINNGGTLEATGRKMPSQVYLDQKNALLQENLDSLNATRLELMRNLINTYVDNRIKQRLFLCLIPPAENYLN